MDTLHRDGKTGVFQSYIMALWRYSLFCAGSYLGMWVSDGVKYIRRARWGCPQSLTLDSIPHLHSYCAAHPSGINSSLCSRSTLVQAFAILQFCDLEWSNTTNLQPPPPKNNNPRNLSLFRGRPLSPHRTLQTNSKS